MESDDARSPALQGDSIPSPKHKECLVLKKWWGCLNFTLGYSGPPGSKYAKVITQKSRVIKNTVELESLCDTLVKYSYVRVRGPAGRVADTPALQHWKETKMEESLWQDHVLILVVHKHRYPKIESVSVGDKSGILKVLYSAERRAGQMESRHGLYMVVQVACDSRTIEEIHTSEHVFECVAGTADKSDEEDDDNDDDDAGEKEEKEEKEGEGNDT